jgi:hypothetical protein
VLRAAVLQYGTPGCLMARRYPQRMCRKKQHLTHWPYRNRKLAFPVWLDAMREEPDYFWAITSCKWMDSGREERGNPHYHVVKWKKLAKKNVRAGTPAAGLGQISSQSG